MPERDGGEKIGEKNVGLKLVPVDSYGIKYVPIFKRTERIEVGPIFGCDLEGRHVRSQHSNRSIEPRLIDVA